MQFVPFHSRDEKHKSHFGSIAAGEFQRLCVLMPRSFSCSSVTLCFHEDGKAEEYRNLFWCGMNGENEEWWDITLDFPKEGLYFYHFSYTTPFGIGNIFCRSSGCGEFAPEGKEWQQTVYKAEFKTPDFVKGGIMYQIFPDRFFDSRTPKKDVPKDRILHENKNELPLYKPDKNGKILNNDYFGGDLNGIAEKLDYLKSLNVTLIYLNPIFEAHQNHRYNTADYEKIDPLLGTEKDLTELVKKADEYGIKIILDGVFSHTGDDSIYFNRRGRYPGVGAFQSENSPYREWYTFKPDGTYNCWWGIETLPEVDEENDGYIDFITGKNGIVKKWLKTGIAGFRLDVADELPDKFLDALYRSVKEENSENFILGEVWEDASNKISHGGRRRYLCGDQLDSVMNYPFATAILTFMRYGVAENFMEDIVTVCENYPKPALDALMNHLGTHDTARILSRLVCPELEKKNRELQANFKMTKEQYEKAKMLLKSATVLQYTLPGFPSIYYGDEAGVEGGSDPFNRTFFPWGNEDEDLTAWFIRLGQIRTSLSCLKDGVFKPYSAMLSCVAYSRETAAERIFVIANRNSHKIDYRLPEDYRNCRELITDKNTTDTVTIPPFGAAIIRKNNRD